MRNFLLALLLLLAVIFLIGRFAEVQAIAETLRRGDLRFIFLAVGVQTLWFFNVAFSYRSIYSGLGMQEDIIPLTLMAAGANFANIIAPSVGMSGVAVLASEARRRGNSTARATVGGVLFVLIDYAGFFCILAVGLFVLFRRNNLNSAELVATVLLFLLAVLIAGLLYLGMRSADSLGCVLRWFARQVNRILRPFLRREYLSEQRAYHFAHDAAEGMHMLRKDRKNLVISLGLAVSSKVLLLTILALILLAFKVPVSIGTIIASFSISYLFLIISPTPAGLGFVEGALTLALSSMYITVSDAAVITLAYRGITFWLPLAFGGIALRLLPHT